MTLAKFFPACCLALAVVARSQPCFADDLDAGPLFDQFNLTFGPGERTEAFGPLFNYQQSDSQRQWALPPLLSHTTDPGTDSEEFDFVYPLLTYDRFGADNRWQFFQLLSWSGGQSQRDISQERFTLFPFYFQQRSPDPEQNYTALFPLYGHIKDRLFRNEIFFVAFPLYGQTRKREVITDNYVYPFFHLRHGGGVQGWQFWPLVGDEHKAVTTRTNGFGEIEIIAGHDRFFALWPFFFDQVAGLGTDNPQREQALLPLYSYLRSPNRNSTSALWPFFNYIDDREKKYREWQTPWPIVVIARGEDKTTTRVWPLFSQAHSATYESDFYLWPVYKYNRLRSEPLDRERTRILFFLYSDVTEKNTGTGAALHCVDFWPLFTHRRDLNGDSRLQVFSLLEPLLPNNKSIERDYSPLWSVWRSERNAKTGAASQSFLWNLYRRETSAASKKCSLLFGLFQYQSGNEGKRLRLFYIPIVKTKNSANDQPKQ